MSFDVELYASHNGSKISLQNGWSNEGLAQAIGETFAKYSTECEAACEDCDDAPETDGPDAICDYCGSTRDTCECKISSFDL